MLKRPAAAERQLLAEAVVRAADAVETVLAHGAERAMNEVNTVT